MRTMRMRHPIDSKRGRTPIFRHDLRQDIGQAFVELALVLPIFMLLLVGLVEVGRLAYASIAVSNAARAGVAYGAQSHTTAADSTNINLAATQDAPNITSMTATTTNSCACESTTGVITAFSSCAIGVTNTTTCPSPSSIVVYVQVTTQADVDTLFHFPGIPTTVTLRGYASMRTEQ
jgi:Flp pilus assembly protein TadG